MDCTNQNKVRSMQSITNLYSNLIWIAVTPSFMGKVNSNSRFENIEAYLMKDSIGGIMIRTGSIMSKTPWGTFEFQ